MNSLVRKFTRTIARRGALVAVKVKGSLGGRRAMWEADKKERYTGTSGHDLSSMKQSEDAKAH